MAVFKQGKYLGFVPFKNIPYSGYFARGVCFMDSAQRAQFVNFKIKIKLIIESGCGQLDLLPLFLEEGLASSAGPLSRPRHVSSTFVSYLTPGYDIFFQYTSYIVADERQN